MQNLSFFSKPLLILSLLGVCALPLTAADLGADAGAREGERSGQLVVSSVKPTMQVDPKLLQDWLNSDLSFAQWFGQQALQAHPDKGGSKNAMQDLLDLRNWLKGVYPSPGAALPLLSSGEVAVVCHPSDVSQSAAQVPVTARDPDVSGADASAAVAVDAPAEDPVAILLAAPPSLQHLEKKRALVIPRVVEPLRLMGGNATKIADAVLLTADKPAANMYEVCLMQAASSAGNVVLTLAKILRQTFNVKAAYDAAYAVFLSHTKSDLVKVVKKQPFENNYHLVLQQATEKAFAVAELGCSFDEVLQLAAKKCLAHTIRLKKILQENPSLQTMSPKTYEYVRAFGRMVFRKAQTVPGVEVSVAEKEALTVLFGSANVDLMPLFIDIYGELESRNLACCFAEGAFCALDLILHNIPDKNKKQFNSQLDDVFQGCFKEIVGDSHLSGPLGLYDSLCLKRFKIENFSICAQDRVSQEYSDAVKALLTADRQAALDATPIAKAPVSVPPSDAPSSATRPPAVALVPDASGAAGDDAGGDEVLARPAGGSSDLVAFPVDQPGLRRGDPLTVDPVPQRPAENHPAARHSSDAGHGTLNDGSNAAAAASGISPQTAGKARPSWIIPVAFAGGGAGALLVGGLLGTVIYKFKKWRKAHRRGSFKQFVLGGRKKPGKSGRIESKGFGRVSRS